VCVWRVYCGGQGGHREAMTGAFKRATFWLAPCEEDKSTML
jgi:hypothetical protein